MLVTGSLSSFLSQEADLVAMVLLSLWEIGNSFSHVLLEEKWKIIILNMKLFKYKFSLIFPQFSLHVE